MKPFFTSLCLLLTLATASLAGCAKSHDSHGHEKRDTHGHGHHHQPPHGGAAVVLGDEAYHIEFVREASTGVLQAYLLDGEMEKFIRSSAPSLELTVTVGGVATTLSLKPVANAVTGETIGDTSLFEAQADWLKTTATFDAVINRVTIRGQTYERVAFTFPTGSMGHGK